MVPGQGCTVVVVVEKAGVEYLRYVAEARNLVGAGAAGEELACACPEGLFDGEETLALDEGAFDLAVVDSRVDGVADVLETQLVFDTAHVEVHDSPS